MQNSKQIFYAFIDSQNLNLSIRQDIYDKKTGNLIYTGWKLDFQKFHVYLKDKYHITKTFLFIGKKKGNEKLYAYLKNAGYQIIFKPTLDFKNEQNEINTKGNVDAELVLHTMIEFPNYDAAFIVAGDGDYYCLIDFLEKQRKLGGVLIPNRYSYSSLLKRYRKYFIYISDLRKKLCG